MVNLMDAVIETLVPLGCSAVVFLILTAIGVFISGRIKNSSHRLLNFEEYLPKEEIQTLKQVFYLIMMACCFVNVIYSLLIDVSDMVFLVGFDIVLSLYIAVTLDKSSLKNKILWLLLVPYASLGYLFFFVEIPAVIMVIDIIHIIIFIYFIKMYFDKFMEYTQSNGLGVTIILLFTIVFASFLFTQVVEDKNLIDSLVMVSNAFTSNGYAVLGNSTGGKINSLFLVWGGYVISGAGTATLTAAILMKHFNRRFRELEKLIDEGDE